MVPSSSRQFPWQAMDLRVHGQVKLTSVCTAQKSPEKSRWPTKKGLWLLEGQKTTTLRDLELHGGGEGWGRDGEGFAKL